MIFGGDLYDAVYGYLIFLCIFCDGVLRLKRTRLVLNRLLCHLPSSSSLHSIHFLTIIRIFSPLPFFWSLTCFLSPKKSNPINSGQPIMSKKGLGGGAALSKDAPWRASGKPIPKIHHAPLLRISQSPFSNYALSVMKASALILFPSSVFSHWVSVWFFSWFWGIS